MNILYNLTPVKFRRKIFFPLSQRSRIVVSKPKHKFGNIEFKSLTNEVLAPKLKERGFLGRDYIYYRVNENSVEMIQIGTSPYGKAVCINAGIDKNPEITIQEIKTLESIPVKKWPWEKLHPNWTRLKPDNGWGSCWWWFRADKNKNNKVLKEMYNLIFLEGEKYFKINNE